MKGAREMIGGMAGLAVSAIGFVLSPALFGWMYAWGEDIRIHRELLSVQKELLSITLPKDKE